MMEPGVYIAEIVMKAVPASKKSRLHPINATHDKYPILLDEHGNITHECKKRICKNLMGDKSVNYDRYIVTLKYKNQKFSTKSYGS